MLETEAVPEICAAMTSEPHGPTLNLKASVVFRTTEIQGTVARVVEAIRETIRAAGASAVVHRRYEKPAGIDLVAHQKFGLAPHTGTGQSGSCEGEVPAPNLDNARILDGHPYV